MESSFDFEARVRLCHQWYVSTPTSALTRDVAQVECPISLAQSEQKDALAFSQYRSLTESMSHLHKLESYTHLWLGIWNCGTAE
jgi:hypothetical protein